MTEMPEQIVVQIRLTDAGDKTLAKLTTMHNTVAMEAHKIMSGEFATGREPTATIYVTMMEHNLGKLLRLMRLDLKGEGKLTARICD